MGQPLQEPAEDLDGGLDRGSHCKCCRRRRRGRKLFFFSLRWCPSRLLFIFLHTYISERCLLVGALFTAQCETRVEPGPG